MSGFKGLDLATPEGKAEAERRAAVALTQLLAMKKAEAALMRCTLALMAGDTAEAAHYLFATEAELERFAPDRLIYELERQSGRTLEDSKVYSGGAWRISRDVKFMAARKRWREAGAAFKPGA